MEYQTTEQKAALELLLAGGGRKAVEQINALSGVDFRLDKEKDTDVRVMSANVEYVRWDSTDPKMERYENRMKLTAECINTYMADFVGLQECCDMMRKPLNPHLNSVYAYVEYEQDKPNTNYFPILYRTDLWRVEESGTGEYPASVRPWGYVWATFSRLSDPADKFTMMNLHYVPASFVGRGVTWDEYRNPLAEELNGFIRSMLEKNPDIPIAVTGDYNTRRDSELYEIMVKELPMEEAALLTEDSNMTEEQKRNWAVDHISVSHNNVAVVAQRQLDYYPKKTLSDHWHYFADLRKV
ncbi:MAG: hypothetical protein E7668_04480 [Ruminococcaceae bacterium]|nr:hypothetical protein [Oscillospiraceae bacterium]